MTVTFPVLNMLTLIFLYFLYEIVLKFRNYTPYSFFLLKLTFLIFINPPPLFFLICNI